MRTTVGSGRASVRGMILLLILGWPTQALAKGRLWDRLLDFLGVTVGSGQTKGDSDPATGRLFTKDLVTGVERPLTTGGGYRWPIFSPDGKSVYALRGDQLVTIDLGAATIIGTRKVPKVDKLVGADRKQSDQILVLRKTGAAPVALLSVQSGKLTDLPYNPNDEQQALMLAQLSSEERVYGSTRLFVQRVSKPSLAGTSEWQEIYIQPPGAPPHSLTTCAGSNCRHPSLSPDGKQAVWVRADD
jgi:hypothetical protein